MSPNEQWSLEELTLRQLRGVAQQYKISRYSRMTKTELIEAIQEAQVQQQTGRRTRGLEAQVEVEDSKFRVGTAEEVDLNDIDADLGDLPDGYGESRIVILPRDPQWAYVYWDVPNEHREELRRQGGQQLSLRLYDVTDLSFNGYNSHSVQEFPIDELAREWYLPISISDRDFVVDIGYRAADSRWLVLARSASVRIPPAYPSDWIDDRFITIPFDMDLRGKTVYTLVPPYASPALQGGGIGRPYGLTPHEALFEYAGGLEAAAAGSLFGSHQQLPELSISSYAVPSGIGFAAFSGALFSGALFSGASVPPGRARGFWLVADAELIIYGATEPDATVTIGGQQIDLAPDGTFRFQYAFPDGLQNFPIEAVAADGEQRRAITMRFLRQTPLRNTNTKAEIKLEAY
ncbi:DUF4912 domain-containing protein [Gloeobacter kilaueensis]|uniref:Transcription termination factor Rho n=1 Tax=Gloeobacter kilaueensis (strain ATCC BAA-2537 / CCAP 1431/1 / ULC 316 / JS1) TaxID=1183438 RepID=U5QRE0_GLOK1|nr:DUF4912 domain-containing protein [Gloeobacter kilaueensis]AGY60280.1 transcription termination factor Rho [Gloeobacter kilaueensis JS1]